MSYRRSHNPYWLTAKYDGHCQQAGCSHPIRKGDRAFYYLNSRKILAVGCGHAESASADYDSHAFDETNNGSL
jgi:hypothetical protein